MLPVLLSLIDQLLSCLVIHGLRAPVSVEEKPIYQLKHLPFMREVCAYNVRE